MIYGMFNKLIAMAWSLMLEVLEQEYMSIHGIVEKLKLCLI